MSEGTTPYRPRRAMPSVVADDDFEDTDVHGESYGDEVAPRRSSGADAGDTHQGSDPDWIAHQLNGKTDTPPEDPSVEEADVTVLRPPAVTPAEQAAPYVQAPPYEQNQPYKQNQPYGQNQTYEQNQPYGQPSASPVTDSGWDQSSWQGTPPEDVTIPHRDVAMARPSAQERVDHPSPQPAPRVEIPHAPTLQPTAAPAAPVTAMTPNAPAERYTAKRSAGRGGRILPASRRSPSEPGGTQHRGARVGVVIGAVAATLVVVLAIGYAVFSFNQSSTVAVQPGDPGESTAAPSAPPETLSDQRLLNDGQAKALEGSATWAIAMTQTGIDETSPVAACLSKPTEAEAPAEKTMIRTLSGSGKRTMSALHQADLYPTKDDAVGVFGERSKALGGCVTDKAYLDSAVLVRDLSNQAIGVTVTVNEAKPVHHTVLLVQTGRMINVFDTATSDRPVTQDQLATAAASVVNTQCTAVIGLCADKPRVTQVVPPIGGDQPGMPVAADIPMIKGQTGRWAPADVTQAPSSSGTLCERYDFSKASGPTARLGRTYLMEDDDTIPNTFGVDEIILTMRNEQEATKLADQLRSNIRKCGDRLETATVSGEAKFDSVGAQQTKINGVSFKVQQKTTSDTVNYRVSVNTAGTKVIYTFLPVDKSADFTDEQWEDFNNRASQRATQIS